MADNPEIATFEKVTCGYNYIELSLALLKIAVGASASHTLESGITMSVNLGGSYGTNVGPSISGTLWLGLIGTFEYAAAGGKSVKVKGGVSLHSAVAENGGAAAKLHTAGLRLLASGLRQGSKLSRTKARATRVQNSGASSSLGGKISTGN